MHCILCFVRMCHSAVPTHAHYLCKDFESVIRLVSEPPLCHIVETIWVLGGPAVYQVRGLFVIYVSKKMKWYAVWNDRK